jgi:hypothetical protein
MLTFPREIIEHENTCKETAKKYHKVRVVFHADWSYDECSITSKEGYAGILQFSIRSEWLEKRRQAV